MSFGLEVRGSSNAITFSIHNRLLRLISTYVVNMPAFTTSVTVTVPGILPDGTWFALIAFPLFKITIQTGSVLIEYASSSSAATWTMLIGRY